MTPPELAQTQMAIAQGGGLPPALPRHVAIIMDGNGRWAKRKHLPRAMGHKQGVEAVRRVVTAAKDMGIEALTLYAFSSENWKRPEDEVAGLMGLLRAFLTKELDRLVKDNVRLKILGDYSVMPGDVTKLIDEAVARTAVNTGPLLAIALNYGARDEMLRAVRSLAGKVAAGEMAPDQIDETAFEAALYTADMPPLDLIIRTSGELRLSNFLLWQAAYAELYFTDILWPDFTAAHFAEAVASFSSRERRYGGR